MKTNHDPQPAPGNIRLGAPYNIPAFEAACREMGIWGTAQAALCAVFWRQATATAGAWTAVKDGLPSEGAEVTVRLFGGQVRQVVRDHMFCGGWKQVNCSGWECVSMREDQVTHWHPAIVARPDMTGPSDAPWRTA